MAGEGEIASVYFFADFITFIEFFSSSAKPFFYYLEMASRFMVKIVRAMHHFVFACIPFEVNMHTIPFVFMCVCVFVGMFVHLYGINFEALHVCVCVYAYKSMHTCMSGGCT